MAKAELPKHNLLATKLLFFDKTSAGSCSLQKRLPQNKNGGGGKKKKDVWVVLEHHSTDPVVSVMHVTVPSSARGGDAPSRVHKVSRPCARQPAVLRPGRHLPNKSLQMWGFLWHEGAAAQPKDGPPGAGSCSQGGKPIRADPGLEVPSGWAWAGVPRAALGRDVFLGNSGFCKARTSLKQCS